MSPVFLEGLKESSKSSLTFTVAHFYYIGVPYTMNPLVEKKAIYE